MGVAGRTHKPVVNKDLCQRCGICVGMCPGRVSPDFRQDRETVRGLVYQETDLADRRVLPPCTGACPLGQKVREYAGLLEKGEVKEALLTIRKDNPLPGLCAYVCHHPCEEACVRGTWDDPVAIRELKRYAVRYEMENAEEVLGILEGRKRPLNGKRVAVIGAGPAGLSCAYSLLMAGFEVEVLDARKRAGGMPLGGIPRFRLPSRVIEHDVGMIRSLGAVFALGVRVGEDVSLQEIQKEAQAVVVAIGAWKDLTLDIPGGKARGMEGCLDFLEKVNRGERNDISGTVAVIGGGNAAMDTARSALRVGAREVVLVYRRTREEMPADTEEVERALEEGVRIHCLAAPKRVLVEEGAVKGVEFLKTEPAEPDASGRRRPVPVAGSEFVLQADRVIPAIGQRPDVGFLDECAFSSKGTVACQDSGLVQGYEAVFGSGDVVSGPSTVVEAAASGKKTAHRVIEMLQSLG